jgi:hypothetical protein
MNGNHPITRSLIKLRKSLELRDSVLFCHPDFNKPLPFHLYTGASDHQFGSVIMQDEKPIALYSPKFNKDQKQDTTTERDRELLSAIETCKAARNIQEYPVWLP